MLQQFSVSLLAAAAILIPPSGQAESLHINRHLVQPTYPSFDRYGSLANDSSEMDSEVSGLQSLYDGAMQYLYGSDGGN